MITVFEKPNVLLKLEGLAVFLLALAIFWQQSFSWSFFWSTVLLPDLALFGYFINTKVGARLYNITHSKLLPSALAVGAIVMSNALFLVLALIWFVHIGFDRMLGYGLKYPEGFKITHLGAIGKVVGEPRRSFLPCWK
ncbi:DUF4260 family protein [Nitrosomonas sp. HPC101]|uniref:DUF4260 domain-containing protein n=1 Tax=Nitrosomonas sp. HPC101 TaxID=1658667 RepID=UPI001368A591|nr:DUF4260 domain-containing protein [Nitrosomonas sp. HPC101]MXS86340.1 DUF4260 family protein [Nitrosomonas sp. HPC101]